MILVEFSPPIQWRPKLKKIGGGWRFMWGLLVVAWVPFDFNEFIDGICRTAVRLYESGDISLVEQNLAFKDYPKE